MGLESNKCKFFKLLFHLFSLFIILTYVKKCTQFLESYWYNISYIFSILIKIIFDCYRLLIELVPKINKQTERKKMI